MKHELTDTICDRLEQNKETLRAEFARDRSPVESRFAVLDDVLKTDAAESIFRAFPPVAQMRHQSTFRERKYTSRGVDKMHPLVRGVTFCLSVAARSIEIVAEITGMTEPAGRSVALCRRNQHDDRGTVPQSAYRQFAQPGPQLLPAAQSSLLRDSQLECRLGRQSRIVGYGRSPADRNPQPPSTVWSLWKPTRRFVAFGQPGTPRGGAVLRFQLPLLS